MATSRRTCPSRVQLYPILRWRILILLTGAIVWMFLVVTHFHLRDALTLTSSASAREPPPRSHASDGRGGGGARARAPPPPPPDARFTAHWCHSRDWLPDHAHRASCLFRHLCVVPRPPDSPHGSDRHEVEFLYVYDDADGAAEKRTQRVEEGDASFTLGVGPHSGDERVVFAPVPIAMAEFRARYPTPHYVTGTSVLYYEYNSENFGHLLTDVLLPIYVALQGFGLEQRDDITLFRYSIRDAIGWSCDFHRRELEPQGGISPRYGNVGKHCDRFYAMTPQLMRGHRPLQVLNGTAVAPTCFQTLVAGMPMHSDDCLEGDHGREQDYWSLCNHARQGQFWQFRNYVLRNALGEDADVEHYAPTHHKIAVTYRKDDIRGLTNLDRLIGKLQDKYSHGPNSNDNDNHVEVVVVEWEKLSIREQLELIRTTTVHITPPGGVSFVALFLPRWATSIRLYSMEFRMEWHLYHYLGYITVEHVDCRRSRRIPLDATLGLVEDGLRRYDEYRAGGGGAPWTAQAEKW